MRGLTARRGRQAPEGTADFDFVFVVTYGRSGSTLVQGLLNTLPGTLVRGENNFYVLPLYRAQALARGFQRTYGRKPAPATSAFYGLAEMDLTAFEESTRQLMIRQMLGGVDPAKVRVLGFKEVLWHRIRRRETQGFFRFFDAVFPNVRYVLNQRDHEQVLGSGFWQRKQPAEGIRALERVEEIQAFLRETRPTRVYDTRYETLTGPDRAASEAQLQGLAEFVTGSCDAALLKKLRATLKVGHGPNPFGASRGGSSRRSRVAR
jgi:hypothetical protein